MFLPITTKKYWFVNSYLAVYIFSPYINKLLNSLKRPQLHALAGSMVLLFSLRVTVLPITWAQDSTGGMGFLWLATLYVIGAWLRITDFHLRKNSYHGLIYLLMAAVLVVSKGAALRLGVPPEYSGKLYGYPSVFTLTEAVSLFLFLLHQKPIQGVWSDRICRVSRHSLAVYLIHFAMVGTLFTNILRLDRLHANAALFVPAMLAGCAAVYVICTLVDMVKDAVFSKIKPSAGLLRAESRIDSVMNGE